MVDIAPRDAPLEHADEREHRRLIAGRANQSQPIGNPIKPYETTVANAPDAGAYEGAIIYVTDGDAGSKCLAVSDGTNWLRIALGAAISTT